MRRSIVVANWKMNGNLTHNEKWFETFNKKTQQEELNSLDIVVAPSFPYLAQAQKSLQGSEIDLGVQDISAFAAGAHTGQVSLEMIKDFGAEYVIIGHSERRMFCHEDDNLIASKVKSVLESGLTAILCVGETLEQRESNKMDDIIAKQLDTVLELCKNMNLDKLIIAYEPVWAIGTGAVATPLQADEVHSFIRGKIAHCVSPETATNIQIIYGGSVKADNAKELFAQANIDGGLIGGASLDPESFFQICIATKR